MLKKLLSGALTAALLLAMAPSSYAGAAPFADVSGLECETAVGALYELGVVEGMTETSFAPQSSLTRAQMAAILVRAFGCEDLSGGKTFSDVPEGHWARAYVSAAASAGLIEGMSDTLFAPEENVTLEQCVTMLVRALGYGTEAENLGGYPDGYMHIGEALALTERVSEQAGGEPLARGDMAILVYNALGLGEAELARLLYQGQGSIRIVTPEGKVIYIDPYAGSGYDLSADLILVTHDDPDHSRTELVASRNPDCRIITQDEALAGGVHQSFDLGYVTVQAVEAGYNANHSVKDCVGYVLTLSDGVSIYVSGDTSMTNQMRSMAEWDIDYAFFCCDGAFNMDTEEASRCAALVGAAHSIPYHTKASPSDPAFDLDKAMEFEVEGRLLVDMGQEILLSVGYGEASLTENSFTASDGELGYWLYTPEDAQPGMPLILYLHGGDSRGKDLELLMDSGFPKYLRDGLFGDVPAYIVMPQLESGNWGGSAEAIRELIASLEKQFALDPDGISLTGHSLGGTGAWELAAALPGVFSRVAPLSGAAFPTEESLAALSQTEVWAFVGSADTIIEPEYSLEFAQQLETTGGSAAVTVIEGADHFDLPGIAYLSEDYGLLKWLSRQ